MDRRLSPGRQEKFGKNLGILSRFLKHRSIDGLNLLRSDAAENYESASLNRKVKREQDRINGLALEEGYLFRGCLRVYQKCG